MRTPHKIILTVLLLGVVGAWLMTKNKEAQKTTPATQVERPSRPNVQKTRESRWPKLTAARLPLETRLNIARSIESSLSPHECTELFALMRHQPHAGDENKWWVVLNELMEQMRKHGAGANDYTSNLAAILADDTLPEVTRDYAAQQLAQWISPANPESPGETKPARRQEALSVFAKVITDENLTHSAIPGTALMALTDASLRLPEEKTAPLWEKIDPVLLELIDGTRPADLILRLSAIQSAALRRSEIHLPAIRTFANDDKADPSLRLSSIAALGQYADPKDRDTLEKIARSNTKFQYAAKAALQKTPSSYSPQNK